jgi:hypothetical protein
VTCLSQGRRSSRCCGVERRSASDMRRVSRRWWVDDGADQGDLVGGEPGGRDFFRPRACRRWPRRGRCRRSRPCLDPVWGDEALDPLELGADAGDDAPGLLGDGSELVGGEVAGSGHLALDSEYGHGCGLAGGVAAC